MGFHEGSKFQDSCDIDFNTHSLTDHLLIADAGHSAAHSYQFGGIGPLEL